MIDKKEVGYRFNKSWNRYNENAHVQRYAAKRLAALFAGRVKRGRPKVLEIGCGTGLLTKELVSMSAGIEIYINDLLYDSCNRTASAYGISGQYIIAGDIELTEIPYGLDVIISSSTFQWLAHPEETYRVLASHLAPGGILLFSTFGTENMKEIRDITGKGLTYPGKNELIAALSDMFTVTHFEEDLYTVYFEHPSDVLQHLKNTGVNSLNEGKLWTKGMLQEFVETYADRYFRRNAYPLTYHPVYLVCRKK